MVDNVSGGVCLRVSLGRSRSLECGADHLCHPGPSAGFYLLLHSRPENRTHANLPGGNRSVNAERSKGRFLGLSKKNGMPQTWQFLISVNETIERYPFSDKPMYSMELHLSSDFNFFELTF